MKVGGKERRSVPIYTSLGVKESRKMSKTISANLADIVS